MNVLFLYRGKTKSGLNRVVTAQANSLLSKGISVELFPVTGRGLSAYLKAISRIRSRINPTDDCLIHAHYGLSGIAGLFCRKGRPLVVSFMGSDLLGAYSPGGQIKRWSRVIAFLNALLAKYFYTLSVVKTEEMKRVMLKNTRVAVIPNGVNIRVFYPEKQEVARKMLGLDQNEKIILFPADPNNAEKNYSLAADAFNVLHDEQFRLLDVNNADHEQLCNYYNAADVMLITSFHEGSPNVVKEAMACNCPVVATRVGDAEWLFGDLPGHYIVQFDPEEAALRIDEAVKLRRCDHFTEGRSRITGLGLDADAVADKLAELYNSLIKKADKKK